jgi:RNA 2',3'-cyclic 3'-phosphodiesterase
MSVIRAFIAIDLSPDIHKRLKDVIIQNQDHLKDVPVRWVPSENIHLTLKFLGEVSTTNLEMLTDILRIEVSHHTSFEISVGGSGAYPSDHRPRVLWVGVEAPQDLFVLQKGIANEMEKLGYSQERRPFSPHLTLGRVGRYTSKHELQRISKMLESNQIGFLGVTRVTEVCLYKSELITTGAEYKKLFKAQLLQ